MEKQLKVAALKNGTVIDHLPSDKVFNVISILNLKQSENQISIGINLDSKQLGNKGIIKIADRFLAESEVNKIALIAPQTKINIIKDYEVVEKFNLHLPHEIIGMVQCVNPQCITNNESVPTHFYVSRNNDKTMLRCHYCERQFLQEEGKIRK